MRLRKFIAALLLLAVAPYVAVEIVDSARTPGIDARARLIEQARKTRRDYHIRHAVAPTATVNVPRLPLRAQSSAATIAPPPSPGLPVAITYLDMQSPHSLGKQIGRKPGGDYVHMAWAAIQNFDPGGEWDVFEVVYAAYRHSTASLVPGYGGAELSLDPVALGQYTNMGVNRDNSARPVLSQREDLSWPRVPFSAVVLNPNFPSGMDYGCYGPTLCGNIEPPRIAMQTSTAADDSRHVLGHGTAGCGPVLYYWRFDEEFWDPVVIIDSVFGSGSVIAADHNSDKVAIILHDNNEPGTGGANNVYYYESLTRGLGWVNGTELGPSFKNALTNYNDTINGEQAWLNIDAAYDHSGRLHIIWDEQTLANKTTNVIVRHWNDERNTIRPVAAGIWPNPHLSLRLNITGLSIGIGDGLTTCNGESNLDYVYVLYTQFAGPTAAEQADVAGATGAASHPNGELYLTVSHTGGDTWTSAANLTNTKTPNCRPQAGPDSVCRSEDWATMNIEVSDIDILYISDHDAGSAAHGIGSYQPNEVMYLRIPGGGVNQQYVCPVIAPGFVSVLTKTEECEYHAEPGTIKNDEILYILNLGNATLTGTVEVLPGAPWLSIPGTGPYTIPGGGNDLVYNLTMDATGLAEGLYSATIRITHNDNDTPSPFDIPIDFFVISDFRCPESAVISTGVE